MSGQAFLQGYEKGYDDAKRGRSRNGRPPLLKSVVNRDRFMQEFMDGYSDGYSTGCKDGMRSTKPSFAR